MTKVFVCVLDGVGAGEAPDADTYGDRGSDTLRHVLERSDVALPNLAALPFLAGASLDQRQAAQHASVAFTTTVINPLTSQGVVVVDLMCDSRLYDPSIYSADGFHPNDSGYAILAADVVKATTSASYPAPAASCSQMTVVPNP